MNKKIIVIVPFSGWKPGDEFTCQDQEADILERIGFAKIVYDDDIVKKDQNQNRNTLHRNVRTTQNRR